MDGSFASFVDLTLSWRQKLGTGRDSSLHEVLRRFTFALAPEVYKLRGVLGRSLCLLTHSTPQYSTAHTVSTRPKNHHGERGTSNEQSCVKFEAR